MAFSLLLPTREGMAFCFLFKRKGDAPSLFLLAKTESGLLSSPEKKGALLLLFSFEGRGMAFSLVLKRKERGSTFSLEWKVKEKKISLLSPFFLLRRERG